VAISTARSVNSRLRPGTDRTEVLESTGLRSRRGERQLRLRSSLFGWGGDGAGVWMRRALRSSARKDALLDAGEVFGLRQRRAACFASAESSGSKEGKRVVRVTAISVTEIRAGSTLAATEPSGFDGKGGANWSERAFGFSSEGRLVRRQRSFGSGDAGLQPPVFQRGFGLEGRRAESLEPAGIFGSRTASDMSGPTGPSGFGRAGRCLVCRGPFWFSAERAARLPQRSFGSGGTGACPADGASAPDGGRSLDPKGLSPRRRERRQLDRKGLRLGARRRRPTGSEGLRLRWEGGSARVAGLHGTAVRQRVRSRRGFGLGESSRAGRNEEIFGSSRSGRHTRLRQGFGSAGTGGLAERAVVSAAGCERAAPSIESAFGRARPRRTGATGVSNASTSVDAK
jgi:hypothetical protein